MHSPTFCTIWTAETVRQMDNRIRGASACLVGILGVDVVFDGRETGFSKVIGCNLNQVGYLGLRISLGVSEDGNENN